MGYYEQKTTNMPPRLGSTPRELYGEYSQGVDWFPGKTALEVETVVWGVLVLSSGHKHYRALPKWERKGFRELAVEVGPERAWIEVERIVHEVEACPWCGARPRLLEMDCDGPYRTADCGSDQCAGPGGWHKR